MGHITSLIKDEDTWQDQILSWRRRTRIEFIAFAFLLFIEHHTRFSLTSTAQYRLIFRHRAKNQTPTYPSHHRDDSMKRSSTIRFLKLASQVVKFAVLSKSSQQ